MPPTLRAASRKQQSSLVAEPAAEVEVEHPCWERGRRITPMHRQFFAAAQRGPRLLRLLKDSASAKDAEVAAAHKVAFRVAIVELLEDFPRVLMGSTVVWALLLLLLAGPSVYWSYLSRNSTAPPHPPATPLPTYKFFLGVPRQGGGWSEGTFDTCMTKWYRSVVDTLVDHPQRTSRWQDADLFIPAIDTAMESNWPSYGQKWLNFHGGNSCPEGQKGGDCDSLPNCIAQAKPATVAQLAAALPHLSGHGRTSRLLAFVMVPRLLDGSYLKQP
jgi:hypothetical protein